MITIFEFMTSFIKKKKELSLKITVCCSQIKVPTISKFEESIIQLSMPHDKQRLCFILFLSDEDQGRFCVPSICANVTCAWILCVP